MNTRFLLRNVLLGISILVVAALVVACSDDASSDDSPSDTPTPAPTTASGGADEARIEITAENLKFDKDEITAPAGEEITVVLHNNDASVPHNISFYESEDAAEAIFKGELVTGVETIEESFTAPEAGTYFFRCDAHPDTMNGSFIVE